MIHENDANINKILTELSDEISFEYDVASDTMLFSERYKSVYGRKNKIPHFYRECRKRDAISENTVVQLDELRRMIDYGDVNRYLQIQWPDKNEKYEWCEIVFRHVIDNAGNIKAVGIWRNIDRQKREQIMLKYQIATEDISGVQNRSGIEQLVGKELQFLELGETAALFLIDIDNMKQIQSTFGVLAAEELLRLFAKELLVHFHEDGIVGHLGSDKFLVYVRSVKEKDTAKILAKRMQKLLKSLSSRLNLNKEVTMCIGIALITESIPYKDALAEADIALRHGKNNGKNQYVFYSQNIHTERYIRKPTLGRIDRNKKMYDAGKIWSDLLERLFNNGNNQQAIEDALELIGNLFRLDKIMVWEYVSEEGTVSNTIQWAREGIPNTKEHQQNIKFLDSEINYVHNSDGIFYCTGPESMPERMREYANWERIQSLLQARIIGDGDVCLGLIDFAVCQSGRVWVQEEVDLLLLMSKVIGEVIRRRQMSSKMEKYYRNTRNILDNVVTGIFVIDQDTKEIYYRNDAMTGLLSEVENQCETCILNVDKQKNNCLIDSLEKCQNDNKGYVVRDEKTGRDYEVKFTRMLWENKKKAYIITVNEHLASAEELERKRKQEYLEKRYAFIYSHSCDCIFDIDVENDEYDVTVVREGAAWSGLEKHGTYSEMFIAQIEKSVAEEDKERVCSKFSLDALRNSVCRGDSLIMDSFVVYSRQDSLHSKEIRAFILEENGKRSVVATYCDVTEQRKKEMQDVLERQKLNQAVVSVYPVVFSVNVTQNELLVMANENNIESLNRLDTRVSNAVLEMAMHLHPEDRDRFMLTFDRENLRKRFSEGNHEIGIEFRFRFSDNNYHWVSIACIRIDNPLNEDLLIYLFARNIDSQKEMEQNLKDALNVAERASEAKSDFLSRMSHEIRTPMNAIIGMTEIAKTALDKPDSIANYLKKVEVSAQYLLSLINNILDMSRIESNKIVIEKKEFRMQYLLDNIKNIIAPQAKSKDITFSIEKKNAFDQAYIGDPLRLNQVLINLLSNALKFTDAGGSITLSVKENRREGRECYICFTVSDTGVGMSEEFMKNMYKPFEQENATSAQGMKGTGLGLSITKNLIGRMDGHIKCKSKKGEGTTFIVEIKMDTVNKVENLWTNDATEKATVDKQKLNLLVGKKILLAEDNELNQEIAVTMLEMLHIEVDCVENGDLAVQKFLEMGSFYYDMILMDIRMPVKNGLDATADIRAIHGKYAEEVPILAMSANAFAEDKAKAFANGMTDYIVKPIDIDLLNEMLLKYLT